MGQDSQVIPLAPAGIRRSDHGFVPMKPHHHRPQRRSKCIVYILLALVLKGIAVIAIGLTILRVKTPKTELRQPTIRDLRSGFSPFPYLNLTIAAEIAINNRNFGSFEFEKTKASFAYGNTTIGAASVHRGEVGARGRKGINVTVHLQSRGLYRNANFSSDLGYKLVWVRSYAKLRGEVRAMKIIRYRKTAVMNCTMAINLTSHSIQDLLCN